MKKLREYKGVTFVGDKWRYKHWVYNRAYKVIEAFEFLDDDDHAALMYLKENPWEPTPTLEQVLLKAWNNCPNDGFMHLHLAEAIRSAFPQIDAPLTASDHIAALVEMGAVEGTTRLANLKDGRVSIDVHVLVLPPEMLL